MAILSLRHRQSFLALVIFAVLATVLLNRALLPDYTLLPLDLIQGIAPWDHLDLGPLANPLISDPFYQFFPSRYFQTIEIGNGQIPLWNPFILTGTPIMADPNSQPFYFPNLIAAVFLPAHHALPWLAWGHLILTGWLIYGFLRQQRLHWLACILGGGIWMLNAYLVVWLENPHRLSTLAWLPGIFWAYQKAVDDRRLDFAAVGGLLLGLSILGGQVQFIFASGLILVLYGLSIVVWEAYKKGRLSLRPLIPLVLIGIIGLGIGAITLLPAGEFAAYSQRVRYTPETILRTRFPWQHFVTLIAPDFYGNPVNPEGYWGQLPNYAELAVYFGVVSFLLALTAPFVARQRRFAFPAITLTIIVIAVILGTPLVRLLFLFPGSQFVVLNRLLFLLPFCGAWLAAIGLDGWLANPNGRRWILVPILLLLVLFTSISLWTQQATLVSHPATYTDLIRSSILLILTIGLLLNLSRHPRLIGGIVVVIAFVDLLQWGWDFNPITSTIYLYPENGVVEYLQQDTSLHRVLPLQTERLVFGPNVLSVFGIQTIGAYTSLIQADYYDLYKAISEQVDFAWLRSSPNKLAMSVFEPMVSLLNVKYVLSAKPLPTEEILQVDQMGCDETVFLNNNWMTQKFITPEAGLNRVDILLAPRVDADDSHIRFRLWRDDVGDDLIAESEILASQSDVPVSHTIFFEPVADSAGQPFVWGITGDENTAVCAVGPDKNLAFTAYGTQLIYHNEIEGIWIYENPNPLPRAYLVHHAETVPSDQLLKRLFDTDFDFYHSILITTPLSREQSDQLSAQPIRSKGQIEITNFDLHRIDLNVTTGQPGILTLIDANYPGWEATVNGSKQEILKVNGAFRGLFLPQGTHTVSFQFRPTTLYWGITLACLSIVLAIAIILWTKFFRGKIARLRISERL
ncbi:MAG: hypothetical protein AMJ56_04375 [Anaerolineae bacterium SG8_19]|nr:MAG: hypothetical protein AMJ56_04375 [Anaerolineae bacterium SG8_19]